MFRTVDPSYWICEALRNECTGFPFCPGCQFKTQLFGISCWPSMVCGMEGRDVTSCGNMNVFVIEAMDGIIGDIDPVECSVLKVCESFCSPTVGIDAEAENMLSATSSKFELRSHEQLFEVEESIIFRIYLTVVIAKCLLSFSFSMWSHASYCVGYNRFGTKLYCGAVSQDYNTTATKASTVSAWGEEARPPISIVQALERG
ncbi:hypothetical protein BDQ17DRAFT_1336588 [Cyathus striatus]|nr:hypothetical protein BDQ17DRAFT_1336588 [Cyathus striatus]